MSTFFNPLRQSLSGRLLIFTVIFVMLAEVLIFTPSVAKFRRDWLDQRLFNAHLAILTISATPQHAVSESLENELLALVGADFIAGRRGSDMVYRLGGTTDPPAEIIDMRNRDPLRLVLDALAALVRTGERTIHIRGYSPGDAQMMIYVTLDESPMRHAMLVYARNILVLSIIISFITAGLVFLSLHAFMVLPLKRLTGKMIAFREDPEDPATVLRASDRYDEIGVAERELSDMQLRLVGALKQKDRLAALGTAVTMINHDLRNMLSAAAIVSEGLAQSEDPKVQRFAPRLMDSIDRAVRLCEMTLDYTREGGGAPKLDRTQPREVVETAAEDAQASAANGARVVNQVAEELAIAADRDQLIRLFANLLRNAMQAGARTITVTGETNGASVDIDVADDGPGLPPRARKELFKPFAGSGRADGTGLGLAIAREIALAHKGDLRLVDSRAEGTVFRVRLPLSPSDV